MTAMDAFRPPRDGLAAIAFAVLLLATGAAASDPPAGWKTYRNERFGFELSYPPQVVLQPYLDGRSGELRDSATGERVVDLELWPADHCPRPAAGTTAKAIGLEHAAAVTQADGPGSSSACGEPVKVREWVSPRGVRLYELGLTCTSERLSDDAGPDVVRESEGTKGPTFFADVSQPWKPMVLMVDPAGVDPRMGPVRPKLAPAVARQIVETVATFPIPDPKTVCIEDLRGPVGGALGARTPPAP